MKVAIYGQSYSEVNSSAFSRLHKLLHDHKANLYVHQDFHKLLKLNPSVSRFKILDNTFDVLISIGGDGTILRAATLIRDIAIPIIGINTGRLGFLATVPLEELETAIAEILKHNFGISKRSLLQISTSIPNKEIAQTNFALNEIAVSRKNTTSMITVETHLDNEYLTSYWADGLIISTPTGSTGYSLSCGGPVITPESNNFVITPIAPHNLNARPLVINNNTEIRLKIDGREKEFLVSLDSRIVTLPNSCISHIKKSDFFINLIEIGDESFLNTLRKKLLWGEDKRN